MMGVAKMAISEGSLGSYVPGALCTREVGEKNETSFLGSRSRGGTTAYTREVRGKSQKDSSTSELHCDKVNLLLDSKSIVQKRRRKGEKEEPGALY